MLNQSAPEEGRETIRFLANQGYYPEDLVRAMRFVWERMKLVVEPTGVLALAAAMHGQIDVAGHRVGIILSGGNVDLDRLPW